MNKGGQQPATTPVVSLFYYLLAFAVPTVFASLFRNVVLGYVLRLQGGNLKRNGIWEISVRLFLTNIYINGEFLRSWARRDWIAGFDAQEIWFLRGLLEEI